MSLRVGLRNLSNISGRGELDMDEFAVAWFLVAQARRGMPVPPVLPPGLVPPSKRAGPGYGAMGSPGTRTAVSREDEWYCRMQSLTAHASPRLAWWSALGSNASGLALVGAPSPPGGSDVIHRPHTIAADGRVAVHWNPNGRPRRAAPPGGPGVARAWGAGSSAGEGLPS